MRRSNLNECMPKRRFIFRHARFGLTCVVTKFALPTERAGSRVDFLVRDMNAARSFITDGQHNPRQEFRSETEGFDANGGR
jgi:hypothetical protein